MGTPREVLVPDIGDFKNVDVIEVLVKPGDAVQPEQSLIAVESDKATMEIPSPAVGRTESSASAPALGTRPHASPSVRKFARELGVDLIRVKGSGPKGRITQADVQEFVKTVVRGAPAVAAVAARGGLVL